MWCNRTSWNEGNALSLPLKKLQLLQLCVPFNEFLGAAPWKRYRQAAVVVITFDSYDRADAIFRMPDFLAE